MNLPGDIVGKYVKLNYINSWGEGVMIWGKLNEMELNSNDYSYFRMNPIIAIKDGEYKIVLTKGNPIYTIPANSLEKIDDNIKINDLENICKQLNKSLKEEVNEKPKVQRKIGFRLPSQNEPTKS